MGAPSSAVTMMPQWSRETAGPASKSAIWAGSEA